MRVIDAGAVQAGMAASPMRPPPERRPSSSLKSSAHADPPYEPNHQAEPTRQYAAKQPAALPDVSLPAAPPMPPMPPMPPTPGGFTAAVSKHVKSDGEGASLSAADGHTEAMQGWLKKKHAKKPAFGSQWAKRFFSINERYGTLNYSKNEGHSASIMLPLCDIKSVDRLAIEEHGPFCFVVVCPPASLTLKAANNDECTKWMQAISHHAALWRAKAAGRW